MRPLLLAFALTFAACADRAGTPTVPTAAAPPAAETAAPAPPAPPPDTSAVALRRATAADVLGHVREGSAPVTIVNVWATWCGPCIKEFPDLVRAGRELKPEGADLVFVSVDAPSERSAVLAFLARFGASGTAFLKDEADEPFMDALDPGGKDFTLPSTYVFARDGRQLAAFEGPTTHAALTDTVRALLTTL